MDVDLSDPALGQDRDRLACGNCGRRMLRLPLSGHYGRSVDLDLCGPCHLVWFDSVESARLTGSAILELLKAMARLQGEPHRTLSGRAGCPRCGGPLKDVHNRSRWGATVQLECRNGHGAWQTFAQFLGEKGLVRPLVSADRARLRAEGAALTCLNCGAPLEDGHPDCRSCRSVPGVVDLARMARSLDPEGAVTPPPKPPSASSRMSYQCHACGAAVWPVPSLRCGQCGATLACTDLHRAAEALTALGPLLLQHELQPAPTVVARRLDALRRDMPRRRDAVRDLEADAARPADVDFSLLTRLLRFFGRRLD